MLDLSHIPYSCLSREVVLHLVLGVPCPCPWCPSLVSYMQRCSQIQAASRVPSQDTRKTCITAARLCCDCTRVESCLTWWEWNSSQIESEWKLGNMPGTLRRLHQKTPRVSGEMKTWNFTIENLIILRCLTWKQKNKPTSVYDVSMFLRWILQGEPTQIPRSS